MGFGGGTALVIGARPILARRVHWPTFFRRNANDHGYDYLADDLGAALLQVSISGQLRQ